MPDRPEPNGGVTYLPMSGGAHWITGRGAWLAWQSSLRRDRRWERIEAALRFRFTIAQRRRELGRLVEGA